MNTQPDILSDDELRHMIVQVFRMETDRTKQTRIGASDLCDRCDRCLAMKMRGIKRTSPQAERPWFGREWGTAGHGLVEERLNEITSCEHDDTLTPEERASTLRLMRAQFGVPEGTRSERRIKICDIPGYGPVFGTIDLDLPAQIGDLKGSTRKKSALLQDFLADQTGSEAPRRWVKQKDTKAYQGGYKLDIGGGAVVSLSFKEHEAEMAKMVYKMDGYFGQQTLYMHGRKLEGRPALRGSIVWLNRDGNGYFDDPGASGYEDPTRNRDIWILSFDYNDAYAQALIARGAEIFARLEAGAAFADFDQNEHCYACSFEEKEALVIEAMDLEFPAAA